jgi:hypothetical protein
LSQRKRKPGRAGPARGASANPGSGASANPASRRSSATANPPDPAASAGWVDRYSERAERKNAEARAQLVPLAGDEQPWALRIAIGLALIFSLGTLVLMIAGVKVGHRPPSTSWILYVIVMFACAVGMWRHWFQAVLAFMCLLAIAIIILCALLVRFSNLLGLLVPLVLILGGGTLFWKLVRVLARLQMPERPRRQLS